MKEDRGSECYMSKGSVALIAAGMGVGVSFKNYFGIEQCRDVW